jgi:mannose-6-phosphate isomerase-like protein (cupin superfamily)
MKLVRFSQREYAPASHEDRENPGVWKKVMVGLLPELKGQVMMVNWAKLPAGNAFENHYHEDMAEVFVLTKGEAVMVVNDETVELEAGDMVVVEVKEHHVMRNTTNEDVEYLVFGVSRGKGGKTVRV